MTPKGMYDFMGVGEYLNATDGDFEVQVRQRPVPREGVRASMITAAAVEVDGDRVGFYEGELGGISVRVNGKPTSTTARTQALLGGGSLAFVNGEWVGRAKDGSAVLVKDSGISLTVGVDAPEQQLKGLSGTADGRLLKLDGTEVA